MKRHLVLGAVLAALVGVPATSWAVELDWGGHYRIRGFYNDNLTDGDKNVQDSAAYYASQFMLTATAAQNNVSGVVTLLVGSDNLTGNRLLGDFNSSTGPDNSFVDMLEAYIKADFKTWDLTAGRSALKFGNGVVFDDWVDGVWARLGLGGMNLSLGTAKFVESTDPNVVPIGNQPPGAPGSGTGDDADLYFVNAGLGNMGEASNTNVFLLYLDDRGGYIGGFGGQDVTLWTLGASTDLDMNGVKLKGELDYFNGTAKPFAGSDVDVNGYNIVLGATLGAGGLPLGLDLVYTSGQDSSPGATDANINGISGNYPLGLIVTNSGARSLGVTDGTCVSVGGGSAYAGGSGSCVGGDGLFALKASTGITHGPHKIDLAAIWAQATEDPDDNGPADESIGIELDATFTWALTKELSWLVGAGYLLAGDYVLSAPGNTGSSDNLTVLVTELAYSF